MILVSWPVVILTIIASFFFMNCISGKIERNWIWIILRVQYVYALAIDDWKWRRKYYKLYKTSVNYLLRAYRNNKSFCRVVYSLKHCEYAEVNGQSWISSHLVILLKLLTDWPDTWIKLFIYVFFKCIFIIRNFIVPCPCNVYINLIFPRLANCTCTKRVENLDIVARQ